MNLTERMIWTRPPRQFTLGPEQITITTEPHTDLWQRTYYHFRNDNAPVLQLETEEKFFSFVVKTDFSGSHTRFDQCGIVMYLDAENWLKASVEYENESFQHLGSVVTNHAFLRLGHHRHPGRGENHVVSLQPPGRRLLCRVLPGRGDVHPDADLSYVGGSG